MRLRSPTRMVDNWSTRAFESEPNIVVFRIASGCRAPVLKTKTIVTLEHTIAAIAARSRGVCWIEDGEGLALILTPRGYLLTVARPGMPQTAMLPERVIVPRDDGRAMGDGHRLTRTERERAVRTILAG